uniref:Uncharacterized protein n=1 Tax=Molossus molossus TaxID=27622 RepID=A0A7J8JW03_MOLMO|nr:hypothetical protein HJG59_008028 [Molossus molossus]
MLFKSNLAHLQPYLPRLPAKPVRSGLPPSPLTQRPWSGPRVCVLNKSRVLCRHLKLEQLRNSQWLARLGRAVRQEQFLPCGEDAEAGNLSRWDRPLVENFSLWFSHNILLPGLFSAPALPQPLKLAENLTAALLLEPAQPNPLLNTESIRLASNEAADQLLGSCSQCDV